MIDRILDEKIRLWLEENREQILEKWMNLVRIPSVQGAPAPDAPYGAACAQVLETAADYYRQVGIPARICREGGYAVAELGQGDTCVGIYGHGDVVPVGDDWLYTQPFQPVIREGMLIGRGSSDNKSGVMASWCLMSMLKQWNYPLHGRIRAFVGSNEESGMQDMESYVRQEQMPQINLVPDSAFPCSLGEKGILRMWARWQAPLTAVESMTGGDAFNIVLDRVDTVLRPNQALAEQLQALSGKDGVTVAVAADGRIHLTAVGVAKHAASPDGGINATWLTAKALCACPSLPEADRKAMESLESIFASSYGEGLDLAHEDSHFGRLTAVNGMVKTEDGALQISLDVRYGTEFDSKTLEAKLMESWRARGWEPCLQENKAGFLADQASPVPALMQELYQTLSGREGKHYYMAGGTYARYLDNAFAIGVAARHIDRDDPTFVMSAGRGGAHQRDEAIDVESFLLGVRILVHAVISCDQLLNA